MRIPPSPLFLIKYAQGYYGFRNPPSPLFFVCHPECNDCLCPQRSRGVPLGRDPACAVFCARSGDYTSVSWWAQAAQSEVAGLPQEAKMTRRGHLRSFWLLDESNPILFHFSLDSQERIN